MAGVTVSASRSLRAGAAQCASLIAPYGLRRPDGFCARSTHPCTPREMIRTSKSPNHGIIIKLSGLILWKRTHFGIPNEINAVSGRQRGQGPWGIPCRRGIRGSPPIRFPRAYTNRPASLQLHIRRASHVAPHLGFRVDQLREFRRGAADQRRKCKRFRRRRRFCPPEAGGAGTK